MTAVTKEQSITGQQALDVTRRAREALRSLPWLNQAQAAVSWGILMLLVAVLGAIYVSQASRIATLGRQIQQTQLEVGEMRRINAQLERQIAEAQQIDSLQRRVVEMGFVRARPEDIHYIVVDGYPSMQQDSVALPPTTRVPPADTMRQALWQLAGAHLNGLIQGEASDP